MDEVDCTDNGSDKDFKLPVLKENKFLMDLDVDFEEALATSPNIHLPTKNLMDLDADFEETQDFHLKGIHLPQKTLMDIDADFDEVLATSAKKTTVTK
jgi:hypothetical protein